MVLKKNNKPEAEQKSIPEMNKNLSETDLSTIPRDVLFGRVIYDAGGTYGPRIQEYLQLVLIGSGEARIYIDGSEQHLKKGEVALLKQGSKEYFEFAETAKTYHSWCHFRWDLPPTTLRLVDVLPFKTAVSSRMERLIDVGLSLQYDPQALEASLSHVAAAAFWEYVSSSGSTAFSSQNVSLPEPIKRVQAYVRQNYGNDIKLRHLSDIAFVTPGHLTRLFRRHLGTTPIRYLWEVRVRQGASFLIHTGISVEKIAFTCGFKTSAHFSRYVKKYSGQTPRELRTRHWRRE